ncbi:MAG: spermidine/putrescine-binding protein [Flavobacteriales bacterium]|jgi:spermidine/putrescine transport system substrate-binding protein
MEFVLTMLGHIVQKLAVICIVVSLTLAPDYVFAENQQILRLLVWEGYAPETQREKFRQFIFEKYTIDVILKVAYIKDAEDGFAALRLKKADIVSPAHNRINDKRFKMIDSGLLLPLNLDNLPNYQQLNPSFKQLTHLVKDSVHYGLPFAWGPYGLVYNTEVFDEAPQSWNVLWDPKYKGQYSVADYGEINIYLSALAMGYEKTALGDFDRLNNKAFKVKLAALLGNAKSLWIGVDTANDLLQNKLASSWGFSLPELKRRGEIWKWAYPKEGVPGWIDNHVLSQELANKPKLKRIAEEWINFTISSEFQTSVLVEALSTNPVNMLTVETASKIQKQGFYAKSLNEPEALIVLMPELDRRTRNGIDNLWNEALKHFSASSKDLNTQ